MGSTMTGAVNKGGVGIQGAVNKGTVETRAVDKGAVER